MNTVFGVDPGFGNIKLYSADGGTTYASHASQATGKSYDSTIDGTATDRADTIEFLGANGHSRQYYTGKYAPLMGMQVGNLGLDRLLGGDEIKALFYGAMSAHIHQYGLIRNPIDAQVGLPASLLEGSEKDKTISALNAWMVGRHSWSANGYDHEIVINSIGVTSQAIGALLDYAFTEDGLPDSNHAKFVKGEIGVVSIGYNTVELAAVSGGKSLLSDMVGSDTYGVRRLLERINGGNKTKLGLIDLKLRDNALNGQLEPARDGWSELVKGYIGSYWGKEQDRLSRVLVVGGGVMERLLRRDLELFFVGKAHFPDNPIESIARGLYKRGVGLAKRK